MKVGQWEIVLKNNNDSKIFPEHFEDNKCIFLGEVNEEYCIHITLSRDEGGEFPSDYVRLKVFIDGNDTGSYLDYYCEGNNRDFISKRFSGFRKHEKKFAFKFAEPVFTSATSSPLTSSSSSSSSLSLPALTEKEISNLGIIKIQAFTAYNTGKTKYAKKQTPSFSNPISIAKEIPLTDNKKFYDNPSLYTAMGREINTSLPNGKPNDPLQPYSSNVYGLSRYFSHESRKRKPHNPNSPCNYILDIEDENPFQEITVYYHTKTVAEVLRNVLISKNLKKKRAFEDLSSPFSMMENDDDVECLGPVKRRKEKVEVIDLTNN